MKKLITFVLFAIIFIAGCSDENINIIKIKIDRIETVFINKVKKEDPIISVYSSECFRGVSPIIYLKPNDSSYQIGQTISVRKWGDDSCTIVKE